MAWSSQLVHSPASRARDWPVHQLSIPGASTLFGFCVAKTSHGLVIAVGALPRVSRSRLARAPIVDSRRLHPVRKSQDRFPPTTWSSLTRAFSEEIPTHAHQRM